MLQKVLTIRRFVFSLLRNIRLVPRFPTENIATAKLVLLRHGSENPIQTTGIWEQAASVQNFPCSDKNEAALLHWVEVAQNDNSRSLTTTGTRQPERGRDQNKDIAKRDTEMESHEESVRKSNKAYSDMLSRLRERPLMTSDFRVGRGVQNNPNIGRFRVEKGR